MSDDLPGKKEIVETAKAVQEASKTTGKIIDASRELGGMLKAIFGGLASDITGLLCRRSL